MSINSLEQTYNAYELDKKTEADCFLDWFRAFCTQHPEKEQGGVPIVRVKEEADKAGFTSVSDHILQLLEGGQISRPCLFSLWIAC